MFEGQKVSGTMAGATGEITPSTSQDEDPSRVHFDEPKKKKLNPLQKMRNFFRSSKKQPKQKDGKSKSTGALHQATTSDEDEDDGGFRSHKVPTLAGNRSMSEDSIFHPEQQKDTNMDAYRKTAVSMEAINKDDFRTELANKLRGRSQYTDPQHGRHSRPMTAADIIMGSSLKPLPAGSKSRSLENEHSLISTDLNGRDIFLSNWSSSVDGKRPRSTGSLSDENIDMDFTAMKVDTPVLASSAAKHKMSVKPKSRRLSSKYSFRRNRDRTPSPLPQVKEESPPKDDTLSKPEKSVASRDNKTVIQINGIGMEENLSGVKMVVTDTAAIKSASLPRNLENSEVMMRKYSVPEETRSPVKSQEAQQTLPSTGFDEVKLRKRPTSLIETRNSDSSSSGGSELANAFKRMSVKREESPLKEESEKVVDIVQTKKEKEIAIDSFDFSKSAGATNNKENNSKFGTSLKSTTPTSPVKSPTAGISYVLKKEPLKPQTSVTKNENVTPVSPTKPVETKVNEKEATIVQGEITPKLSPTKDALKENEDKLAKLPSPREEYRLKRQTRSKTLPEQPVSKEIFDRKDSATSTKFSQSFTSKKESSDKSEVTNDSKPAVSTTSPIGKRAEPKRLSWVGSSSTSSESTVPAWLEMAKRRQGSSVNEIEKKEPKPVVSLSREPAKIRTTESASASSNSSNLFSSGTPKEQKDILNESKKSPDGLKEFVIKPLVSGTTSSAKTETQTVYKPSTGKNSDIKSETQPVHQALGNKFPDVKIETEKGKPVESQPVKLAEKQLVKPSVSVETQSVKPMVSVETQPVKPLVSVETQPVKPLVSVETQPVKPLVSVKTQPVKPSGTKLSEIKSDVHKPLVSKLSDTKPETDSTVKTTVKTTEQETKPASVATRVTAMKSNVEPLHKTPLSKVQPVKKDTETGQKSFINKTQESKTDREPLNRSLSNKGSEVKKDSEPVSKPLVSKLTDVKKEPENKSSLSDKASLFEKKSNVGGVGVVGSGGSVPSWKANLGKKDREVKIEIIEKPAPSTTFQPKTTTTVQPKTTTKMAEEKSSSLLREKPVEKCTDSASKRKSKVSDLVKNYQKLQVS